jgi:hypothetical protein
VSRRMLAGWSFGGRRWCRGATSIAVLLAAVVEVSSASGTPALPPPQFGRSVDIGLVSGVVIVKPVAASSFRLGTQDRNIPVGSAIDTRHGAVDLRSARPPRTALGAAEATRPVQDAQFSKGQFKILQRTSQRGLTVLDLVTTAKIRRQCTLGSAANSSGRRLSSRVLQTLHARDHGGRFRTRGRYSAGTVRGTAWDTIERCDGTLTVVHRGIVAVHDFALGKTISIHAGHRYLARATVRSL